MVTSQFKSIDYIVTARHYSTDGTALGYLKRIRDEIAAKRGIFLPIIEVPAGEPLLARIHRGQWIADCECGGATFVDPEWPFTYCFTCRQNGDHIRPVTFPENWKEIERVILERPVNDRAGLTDLERAGLARPMILVEDKGGLAREWGPHETVADLHAQQDAPIKAWHKSMRGKH